MVQRSVHYEAAFENYLQAKTWPYVAVDEAKKALFGQISLKSFDFVVYSEVGPNLLVDVKGRKFPDTSHGGSKGASRTWENWITRDDVESMRRWQEVFGKDFLAMLVFAYWLQGPPQRSPFDDVHLFKGNYYAFVCISLDSYVSLARPRSARWQTIAVSARKFSQQARDVGAFL